MHILVTRPQPQADQWVAGLQARGASASALPLIDIAAPHDPRAVLEAWHALPGTRLVMFVSPAAVDWFARLKPPGAAWPADTLVAAPGPGTAREARRALQASGLQPSQVISPPADSAQFDSEHLWPLLEGLAWSGRRVRIVSGGDQGLVKGRTWLTRQWEAAGAQVAPILTYERRPGTWSDAQQSLATLAWAQPTRHVWLLSSSEAVAHLRDRTVARLGPPAPDAVALVTHPKVGDAARAMGFQRVLETRPDLDSVAQARRLTGVSATSIQSEGA